jgi:hypothetical protein
VPADLSKLFCLGKGLDFNKEKLLSENDRPVFKSDIELAFCLRVAFGSLSLFSSQKKKKKIHGLSP